MYLYDRYKCFKNIEEATKLVDDLFNQFINIQISVEYRRGYEDCFSDIEMKMRRSLIEIGFFSYKLATGKEPNSHHVDVIENKANDLYKRIR